MAIDGEAKVVLRVGIEGFAPVIEVHIGEPELGFGAAEAAQHPLGMDEDIDEASLDGAVGVVVRVIVGGEGRQAGGVFVADDLGFGIDASFAGVLTGNGFARDGTRSGGLFANCYDSRRSDVR